MPQSALRMSQTEAAQLMRLAALRVKLRANTPKAPIDPTDLMRVSGHEADPWQRRLLGSQSKRMLLNCSRQSGKSTTVGALAASTALNQPGALVLLLSPTLRQSGELFRKVLDAYSAAGEPEPPEAQSALQLELKNGSRIVSLPGKEGTVRGYSGVDLLIIDEASRVADELYMSVRPMLAVSGGRLIAPSTPFGTRGWWYEAWHSAEPWERYEIPASDCPRIPALFLDEERRNMGEWWFAQEYECRFMDAQSSAFSRADIDRAFEREVDTWAL